MRNSSFRSSLLLAAAALAGGCGAPPNSSADLAHPPGVFTAALGGIVDPLSADSAWVDFRDGQDATLTEGAQGGFHVWMKLRVDPSAPRSVLIQKKAHRDSDDKLVLRSMLQLELGNPGNGGYWEMPKATPMFMCPSPIGISVIDERIRFEMTLSDDAGVELGHAEITLVPRCPTTHPDSLEFCKRICTG